MGDLFAVPVDAFPKLRDGGRSPVAAWDAGIVAPGEKIGHASCRKNSAFLSLRVPVALAEPKRPFMRPAVDLFAGTRLSFVVREPFLAGFQSALQLGNLFFFGVELSVLVSNGPDIALDIGH